MPGDRAFDIHAQFVRVPAYAAGILRRTAAIPKLIYPSEALRMIAGNLFTNIPSDLPDEQIVTLLQAPNVRIERIVSTGHATAPDRWYDQDQAEWVLVLAGSAGLLFEGETEPCLLETGSYIHIAAHVRHRVAWTDPSTPTVRLAIHHHPGQGAVAGTAG